MGRSIFVASLLLTSGWACAQSGGVIVTTPGAPVVTNPSPPWAFEPINIGTLPPADFQLILEPTPVRVFIIADFSAMAGAAMRQADQREVLLPPGPGALLHGEAPVVTVEEEGVRLPDEQFSLP